MGSALQHKPAGYDMILDIIVRLRVWTAWREQLCVRGALREQHRGGRCVASPSVVSPIFSGAVPSLPRTQPGVMHGRACNLLWTPAGSVLASCWKGMWTGVGGFGPRSRHGWMEELSTGFKEKGRATVRAWRDMISDMDGFPLCVGVGLTRDPIQIFYSFLDLPFSGTSWQVRTPRRLPPTRTPCTSI
jgi:hypothetical protein